MDTYINADQERRRQGQIFGSADELRMLRTINARANAMRRMAGNRAGRIALRVTKSNNKSGNAGSGASHRVA